MSKLIAVTAKNFKSKLSSVIKAAKSGRVNLQALIEFGLAHYAEHGDTVYLQSCVDACVGVGSLNTSRMIGFIEAHANITWRKKEAKDGEKVAVFSKAAGQQAEVLPVTTAWWDYEKPDAELKAKDVLKMIQDMHKRIASELDRHNVTDEALAKRALEMLSADIKAFTTPALAKAA